MAADGETDPVWGRRVPAWRGALLSRNVDLDEARYILWGFCIDRALESDHAGAVTAGMIRSSGLTVSEGDDASDSEHFGLKTYSRWSVMMIDQ
jgi:hypothetical protein